VIIALLAALVPASAASLIVATARSKTRPDAARPVDESPAADDDPTPGIGFDSETPLGDTPEHSDAERVARPDRRFE
jgi:hypothetical protein